MSVIQERGSTHVYKVNRISKGEIENMVSLCVYDQPAFCSAACPLKLDAKAMLAAAADGDFKKALGLYEKAVIFPNVVSAGCSAPCEAKCKLSDKPPQAPGIFLLRGVPDGDDALGRETQSGQY